MTRTICFLIYDQFQLLDLAGPLAAFQVAAQLAEHAAYPLHVVSLHGGPVLSSSGLEMNTRPPGELEADTLLVIGGPGVHAVSDAVVDFVRTSSARRLGSVCLGAFLLARTGLLNGQAATTHWRYAARLQRDFPQLKVDGDRIFTRTQSQGKSIWTSAGISAGIDLALAMIEEDLGPGMANAVANELVVYYRRPGGQSQFSELARLQPESDRIRLALAYARDHLGDDLSIARLAEVACLSLRQFGRAFKQETGETPARAIERLRAESARLRLENSRDAIERIALQTGFNDPERMRRAFLRLYGQPPQAFRRQQRAL